MKKSTLIIIGIIYVASIVIISLFGLKPIVYKPVIPVVSIECLNETDEKTTVSHNNEGIKVIKIKFDGPANENDLGEGTVVQIMWRVLPDNASSKNVEFSYQESTRVKFMQDDDGRELGVVLIFGPVVLPVRILATDGTRTYTDIIIWAYV